MLHENREDVIFANISSFEKETKGEKKKEGAIIKCWGKKGQRFWRKNGHEFSSNGYRALPFSFRPSPVWFARAISTSGLSQFLRGSRYLQRRAFRADTECNSGIYPGQCVCVCQPRYAEITSLLRAENDWNEISPRFCVSRMTNITIVLFVTEDFFRSINWNVEMKIKGIIFWWKGNLIGMKNIASSNVDKFDLNLLVECSFFLSYFWKSKNKKIIFAYWDYLQFHYIW